MVETVTESVENELGDNAATALIRKTVDKIYRNQERLAPHLQQPPGIIREYRDDMTVQVVWFRKDGKNDKDALEETNPELAGPKPDRLSSLVS